MIVFLRPRLSRPLLPLALALAALCGLGCKDEGAPPSAEGPAPAETDGDEAAEIEVEVKDDQGKELFKIELEADALEVSTAQRVIQARRLGERKHKFKTDDGAVVLLVKHKDDGFKVQEADGDTLLAKVKRKEGGRLKISDNAENEHALQIRPKEEHRAVLERDDVRLGRVVFKEDGRIKVQDAEGKTVFKAHADKPLFGLGVLLDDKLPEEVRRVIAAELVNEVLRPGTAR